MITICGALKFQQQYIDKKRWNKIKLAMVQLANIILLEKWTLNTIAWIGPVPISLGL